MDITIIIGSMGLVFGLLVAPPQIYKALKTKNVQGVSKRTYQMLVLCMICYLTRAIAIREWIFILSNGFNLFVNVYMLTLIYKYENE